MAVSDLILSATMVVTDLIFIGHDGSFLPNFISHYGSFWFLISHNSSFCPNFISQNGSF